MLSPDRCCARARSLAFLIGAGALSLASLGAFYAGLVTIKFLSYDYKSELAVVIDLPEGASVEAADRAAQAAAEAALALPETVWIQTYAGTAAPFDFNGLVRHYFLRQEPHLAEVRLGLAAKGVRARASHAVALDLRERLRARISTDDLEFFGVRQRDVFDTIAILNGGLTVGYSHRGAGRDPMPIEIARPRGARTLD